MPPTRCYLSPAVSRRDWIEVVRGDEIHGDVTETTMERPTGRSIQTLSLRVGTRMALWELARIPGSTYQYRRV